MRIVRFEWFYDGGIIMIVDVLYVYFFVIVIGDECFMIGICYWKYV